MALETYAYFYVEGFEGPSAEISELLQLTPTRTREKGDPRLPGRLWETGSWQLHSPLPRTEPAQDSHILALLEILESRRDQVLQATAAHQCGLQCVGYYTNENCPFFMEAELISRIAAFGLSVGFDLYCQCDHDLPDA